MNTLPYEHRTFSQHGEDGILKFLLTFVDDKNKNFLEIGWGNGTVNCCRNLLENIDSFDWHLLKSMLDNGFLPKIICHEYNSILGPDESISRKYGNNIDYNKRTLFGASLMAFKKILEKNYNFVTVDSSGVNAFWIRRDIEFTRPEQYYDFNFFKFVKERIYDNGLENFLNLDQGWEYV